MTDLEILEGKKLIAKWLGYEADPLTDEDDVFIRYYVEDHIECTEDGIDVWETYETDWTSWLTPRQMKYDSSYEWIHPVFNKIVSSIDRIVDEKSKKKWKSIFDNISFNTEIDIVYFNCVKYIQWYNENVF